jgi:thioredoxin-dependent peroxiredoxin
MMLQIGQTAPDFTAKDSSGKSIRLHNYSDRWLILYFYPKDNTPGCTTEAQEFTEYAEKFAELGAMIVGVSPDSEKSHCQFIEKHNLSIQLLSDPDHKIIDTYGVWRLKKFMGKEFMGVVRSTFLITPDGKIAYIWDGVRVKSHVKKVLQKLEEIVSF